VQSAFSCWCCAILLIYLDTDIFQRSKVSWGTQARIKHIKELSKTGQSAGSREALAKIKDGARQIAIAAALMILQQNNGSGIFGSTTYFKAR
jgi:hypothetical protein